MVRQRDSVLDKTESQIQGWVPQMPAVGQLEPVLAFQAPYCPIKAPEKGKHV